MVLLERRERAESAPELFRRHFTFGDEPFVIARIPALPVDVAEMLYRDPDPYAAALRLFCERRDVAAAIYVASPSLYAAVAAWSDAGRPKSASVPRKLLSYVVRMATRATPFGTFAGVAGVALGLSTSLQPPAAESLRTCSQADAEWLSTFASVAGSPAPGPDTVVFANDFVERYGDRIDVLRAHAPDGKPRLPVTLRATPHVDEVLERCRAGATMTELRDAVVHRFGVTQSAANGLLDQLWRAGLIAAELRFTRRDALPGTAAYLEGFDPERARALRDVAARLERLDALPLGERTAEAYGRTPLHVELFSPMDGALGANVLHAAADLVTQLLRFGPPVRRDRLHAAFAARCGGVSRMQSAVEFAGLFRDVDETVRSADGDEARDRALARIVAEAIATNALEVALSSGDLDEIAAPFPRPESLPESLEIGFEIAAGSPAAIDEGRFELVVAPFVGTAPAGRLTARFVEAFGEDGGARLRRRVADDADDTITAELAYIPSPLRMLNVIARDAPYDYEIQLGFHRRSPGVTRIPVDDLFVGVDGARFFLWSDTQQKRVRLAESHALGYARAPLIVRALAAVAQDGLVRPARFPWGAQSASPFLPRVRSGRSVLSVARWLVPDVLARVEGAGAFARALDDWRRRWNVPATVYLRERDNRLFLDLASVAGRDLLRARCARPDREAVTIEELYPGADSAWLSRDGRRFNAEFVVCVSRQADAAAAREPRRVPSVVRSRPVYAPGSEWSRIELHGSERSLDLALRRHIPAFVEECRAGGLLRCWSYGYEGSPPARLECTLRAAGSSEALFAQVRRFVASLPNEGLALRPFLTTYEPELEIHGDLDRLACAEDVFMWSAETALRELRAGATSRAGRIEAAAWTGALIWSVADELEAGAVAERSWRPHARAKLSTDEWRSVRSLRLKFAKPRPDGAELARLLSAWRSAQRAHPQRGIGFSEFVDVVSLRHLGRFGIAGAEAARALRLQSRIWAAMRLPASSGEREPR